MKTKKGQYFSFDAIIATLIFILTMVSLLSYWYSTRSALGYQNDEMMKEALRVSDVLFNPRNPSALPSACQVGFSDSINSKVISKVNLVKCGTTPQDQLKSVFGTPYNITIDFKSPDGNVASGVTIGPSIGTISSSKIVKVQRVAAINASGSIDAYIVEVYLYQG